MLGFFRAIMKIRDELAYARQSTFFAGGKPGKEKDLTWFRPDGVELDGDDWGANVSIGAWFSSAREDVVLLLNASTLTIAHSLPSLLTSRISALQVVVDTTTARVPAVELPVSTSRPFQLGPHVSVLLRSPR